MDATEVQSKSCAHNWKLRVQLRNYVYECSKCDAVDHRERW